VAVLGLQFYVCGDCDAVHADVDVPPACGRCGGSAFHEMGRCAQDGSYFYSPTMGE
jgi:hypothetical protein